MTKYVDCCSKCGTKRYTMKEGRELVGITMRLGKCEICKRDGVAIVPDRDWAYYEGVGEWD